jgi:predicted flap endonuclease-1-like 5' DNA nuclease
MALEDTLLSIDATLKTLLTIAQSGATAAAELGETDATAAKRKPGRPRKDEAPQFDLLAGDAEGTRYFVVTKQHLVLKVAPGETAPSADDGAQEIGGVKFVEWQDTFAKKASAIAQAEVAQAEAAKQAAAKAEAAKQAAATAAANAAANAAAAASTTATAAGPSFKEVTEALMKLTKVDGLGRPALDAVMAKFGVTKVPAMEALKKNAEILAHVNALMNPPAAEAAATEDDPFAS